jgi:integrase
VSDINPELWMAERQACQFYKDRVIGLRTARYRGYYRKCLREWVEFVCRESDCAPDGLDYRRCTLVCIGDKSFEMELQRDTVIRFLNSLPDRSTRSKFQTMLHSFFKWLVMKGILSQVPIVPHKRRSSKRKVRPLDMDDISRFTKSLSMEPILKRAPISMLLASGVRVSSLCSLTNYSIQCGRDGSLQLEVPPIKRSSGFIVPLPDVKDILADYRSFMTESQLGCEYLFVNSRGTRLKPKTIGQWVAQVGAHAECSRTVTPHDLRRMCATIHAHSGDLNVVRRILNHKREETTAEYIAEPNVEELHSVVSHLPSVLLVELRSSGL